MKCIRSLGVVAAGVALCCVILATPALLYAKEKMVVAFSDLGDIVALNPAKAVTAPGVIIGWQVYQRLVDIAPDGTIKPMLATGWEKSKDLKVWRFHIRKGVLFHARGGEKPKVLTPADVKYSIEYALKVPGYGRALLGSLLMGADAFINKKADHISGIIVDGEYVVFKLKRPFSILPQRLAASFFSILPKGSAEAGGILPGTGPYKIDKWNKLKGSVSLSQFDKAWLKASPASPEKLEFKVLKNLPLAVEELRSGNVDWIEAASTAWKIARSLNRDKFAVRRPASTDVRLIALNYRLKRFSQHPALAQALNFAVNRSRIVKALGGGAIVPGPVPVGSFKNAGFWWDKPLAVRLVNSLPEDLRKLRLLVEPGTEPRTIAQLVAEDWRSVGFQVELVQGGSDFFKRLVGGDYEIALAYYGPFLQLPDPYLWPYRSNAIPVPNVMRYQSQELDTAYQEYVSTDKMTAQHAALIRATEALLRRPPMVWLVKAPRIIMAKKELKAIRAAGITLFYRMHR